MAGEDRLRELEERYEGFKVYDNNGESIGKVDDLFVDERDREEYIGVKMGLFGLSGTTLIPMDIVRVNDQDRVIEVAESKERVKDAPQYRDDDEIDRSFEERIRSHFGLAGDSSSSGSYGLATGAEGAEAGDNTMRGGETGTSEAETSEGGSRETVGREEYRNRDDSDSSMASAAGGATSGGVSDFETGDRERGGDYREGDRQGGEASTGGGAGSQAGGGGSGDEGYRDAYMEGYRQAIRDSAGQGGGPSGSTGSGEAQGGRSGDQEASEHFGAPSAGPGEKGPDDTQDYQSASTGHQPSQGGEANEGEGRMRVFRLRRDS